MCVFGFMLDVMYIVNAYGIVECHKGLGRMSRRSYVNTSNTV